MVARVPLLLAHLILPSCSSTTSPFPLAPTTISSSLSLSRLPSATPMPGRMARVVWGMASSSLPEAPSSTMSMHWEVLAPL